MSQKKPEDNDSTIIDQQDSILNKIPSLKVILKGMIMTLPFLIILFLIKLLFDLILGIISPLSNLIAPGAEKAHWIFHIISIAIIVGIFYLVGLSIKNRVSKYYFMLVEKKYLTKIPLYTTIRDLVQQFTGLKEMPFSEVVLIDAFETGTLMTGFVTEKVTDDIYTIFVPTAPNPTNGIIYHVPKNRLKIVDATPEEAMRTIVGMGTGSKCLFTAKQIEELEEQVEEQ